ncbi:MULTISPECIES: energy transducer TonB [Alteromonadaceae]|uniref:energy transducer TonB n=1 Tax=Alteromonadaceae TaxID=72275 RepID=UPI001C099799|nr:MULTISPECIES: energy transducer TonB [Aliiglaciecola]MBU2877694.1 energy transducer TonB [Aliiglaciecola lipolytica]MDO6713095.1 energy transducer TonB [Aliiglaciecola sp. 2_MG-2023]MDO6754139.1 energy transducer TonB [Aliiglaciecola sp. 1_MG-2023]
MQNIMLHPYHHSGFKISGFIGSAAIITFGLFVIMQKLTAQNADYITPPTAGVFVDPVFNTQDSKSIERTKIKPIEPPKLMPQTIQPKEVFEPNDSNLTANFTVEVPTQEIAAENQFLTIQDAETTPMVRISPKYPADAARDGIQGWVKLQFSIDASGSVQNIQIIDANPKRTFDREARKALKKWKYRPQIKDGKPIEQTGLEVVLDFKLES